jgi:TRAP-type C4-dicarboxylate transport system substrate-binding protein
MTRANVRPTTSRATRRAGLSKKIAMLTSALALGAASLAVAPSASAETLRIAMLAPKNSAWGKIFKVWQTAVKKRTDDKLSLEIYYNAVQGMEDSMVGKMKSGQLDGAMLSSAGLALIDRSVMAMQLPGMIDDWATLDRARKALDGDVRQGLQSNGFTLVAWSDVGLVHEFSRGFEPRRPEDIKKRRPLVWRSDMITPVLFSSIGTVVPIPLSPAEVLPALRTGKVDYLMAPAIAAEQLQWTPHLEYVTSHVVAAAVGGTVIKSSKLDALPADLKAALLESSVKMGEAQARQVRKDDADGFKRITKTTKIVTLTPAEHAAWDKVYKDTIKRLGQGTFSQALIDKVTKLTTGG